MTTRARRHATTALVTLAQLAGLALFMAGVGGGLPLLLSILAGR